MKTRKYRDDRVLGAVAPCPDCDNLMKATGDLIFDEEMSKWYILYCCPFHDWIIPIGRLREGQLIRMLTKSIDALLLSNHNLIVSEKNLKLYKEDRLLGAIMPCPNEDILMKATGEMLYSEEFNKWYIVFYCPSTDKIELLEDIRNEEIIRVITKDLDPYTLPADELPPRRKQDY
jgi:hypothetical protein